MKILHPKVISAPQFRLQWLTGYLGLTHLGFSCGIAHSGIGLISFFQEFSAGINKTFILAGVLGTKASKGLKVL